MSREVPTVEVRGVLRLRLMRYSLRRPLALLGGDRQIVRRYLALSEEMEFTPEASEIPVALVTDVLVAPQAGRSGGWHGANRVRLASQRSLVQEWLSDGPHLTKIELLLRRRRVAVQYRTRIATASGSWDSALTGTRSEWTTGPRQGRHPQRRPHPLGGNVAGAGEGLRGEVRTLDTAVRAPSLSPRRRASSAGP